MQILRIVWAVTLAMMLSAPASAAFRGDFAGLAICSKLSAIPKGCRTIDCHARAPLRGECRFTLASNGIGIEYLIKNAQVLDKKIVLSAHAGFAAPYGLHHGDDYETAARKIKASTGLASHA